jgi:hypothetical protein
MSQIPVGADVFYVELSVSASKVTGPALQSLDTFSDSIQSINGATYSVGLLNFKDWSVDPGIVLESDPALVALGTQGTQENGWILTANVVGFTETAPPDYNPFQADVYYTNPIFFGVDPTKYTFVPFSDNFGNDFFWYAPTVWVVAQKAAPEALTVHINTIAGDNILNAAESQSSLVISGTTTGVKDGQNVSVEFNGIAYSGIDASGTWSVTVPQVDLATLTYGQAFVIATVFNGVDQATDSRTLVVDIPALQINTIAGDDILNAAESQSSLVISGTTAGVEDGQQVTVTLNGHTYTGPDSSNSWSVTVPQTDVAALTNGKTYSVDASTLDLAGDEATGSRTLVVDIPALQINTIAGDDILNAAESQSSLVIRGTTAGVEDGQQVTVTLNGHTYTGPDSSNSWSVTVPQTDVAALTSGQQYTVHASTSDLAGDPASDDHALSVEEGPAQISIAALTSDVTEGNSGFQAITFEVTRSGDLSSAVTFDWEPANFDIQGGFRVAGAANHFDYKLLQPATVSSITFQPGETTKDIQIAILGDTMPEHDEPLILQISSSDAQVTNDTAQTVITNDDGTYSETALVQWALRQETLNATQGGKTLDGLSSAILDPKSITEDAWNFINENRQWDSQETVLRNSEYYLYGLKVAVDSPVSGAVLALISAPGYDALKVASALLNNVVNFVYQENTDSQNSPAGGLVWAEKGVYDGLLLKLEGNQTVIDGFLNGTTAPGSAPVVPGVVSDGYLIGATVFADANLNSNLDSGEVFTVTDSSGTFTITGGSGQLVEIGGTDSSTGQRVTFRATRFYSDIVAHHAGCGPTERRWCESPTG